MQGPGCLSYAVVLPIWLHADLRDIRLTNALILTHMATALASWQPAIAAKGISDLTVNGQKIGGSAQKRKRNALLFHGTVLYQMQPEIISRYLRQPKRQPDYRADRPHSEFLRTLRAPLHELKQAIARVWHAHRGLDVWPSARMSYAIAGIIERSSLHEPKYMVMHTRSCNGESYTIP